MSYFSAFPTLAYANVVVTDVTRRVTVPPSILRQPIAFSPYTVEGGQREDLVSYLYYGQDDDDWLISLANQIVDPYYGWFMDDDELAAFVIGKYGSLPEAMGRVSHWVTNWSTDSRQVSVPYYDALTENLKKYWSPNFGPGSQVLSYSRRQEDWKVSTNQLLGVTLGAPVPFLATELVSVYDPAGNLKGTGEVVWVSGDAATFKDIAGDWLVGYTLTTSSGSGTVSSTGEPNRLIPIDEFVYFSPVSCYDVEYDRNEQNKEVLLIQDAFRGVMYTELVNTLSK